MLSLVLWNRKKQKMPSFLQSLHLNTQANPRLDWVSCINESVNNPVITFLFFSLLLTRSPRKAAKSLNIKGATILYQGRCLFWGVISGSCYQRSGGRLLLVENKMGWVRQSWTLKENWVLKRSTREISKQTFCQLSWWLNFYFLCSFKPHLYLKTGAGNFTPSLHKFYFWSFHIQLLWIQSLPYIKRPVETQLTTYYHIICNNCETELLNYFWMARNCFMIPVNNILE